MSTLRYRSFVDVDDLQLGECTIHACSVGANGIEFWHVWFHVARDSDGQPDTFSVPINPNGGWIENGPGGKTWGLMPASPGTWQVSPSINVLDTRDVHPGPHPSPSLWHQTPLIVDVPPGEAWIRGAP